MSCHVMSCLFPHDEFPRRDGHRARDEDTAEERRLDILAQELGDAPTVGVVVVHGVAAGP